MTRIDGESGEQEETPAEPLPGPAIAEPEREPTDPQSAARRTTLLANVLAILRRAK